jgi:hypothetical protein
MFLGRGNLVGHVLDRFYPPAPISARRVGEIAILGCSAALGGPYGMGKAHFYKLFSDNSMPNGVFLRGFFTFYFVPLDFILSLPERKLHMIFSQFPAAVVLVLFGHFSGHWRCGSGGSWKVP